MALIYYMTNYATKVEDPVWKRVAAAAEFLPALEPTGEGNGSGADRDAGRGGGAEGVATAADPIGGNKTRTFLLKAANRDCSIRDKLLLFDDITVPETPQL
ncbi:uncharacterized protein HRG_08515 [Hirsutella rhossiliensis]|uniref:Uncharacterized protein n=1 Tax=Hirsutella rhossiliensis TaxID=111463 RepID=A0A9P8MSE6_9HYPO|nr:uncharacterized protein HRG_08515 [Hirsutella rhossiliensis]KAH0960360.1 hypothetical protein HRG_08515 [Hirsutella rhossiliensis]